MASKKFVYVIWDGHSLVCISYMICQRSCRLLPKIFTCLYLINKHSEHHLMHFFFAVWRSQCKSSSWTVQIHTDKSSIPTTQQTASQRYESTISIQNINDHIKKISHYYWHVVFNLLNHSFGALACIIVPNHTNKPVSLRIWNQKLWPWVLVQRHCSFL